MDTTAIAITLTAGLIAVVLFALALCQPGSSHDGAETVVGVQRHGRTYYVRRHAIEDPDDRDAAHGRLRALAVGLTAAILLLSAIARLA